MTRERLWSYQHLRREIRQLEDQLAELESRITSPRTPKLSFLPRAKGNGYALEAGMDRYADLVEIYRTKLERLYSERAAIEQAIESLEPIERMVLRARYIEGRTWEDVAERINYSYVQTWRIHARALQKLEDEDVPL